MDVLAVDVGGSSVKLAVSTNSDHRKRFRSGTHLTPDALVKKVQAEAAGWHFEVIALGFPGYVDGNAPGAEPGNLGNGWVGFDFPAAFGKPVRVVNDAVMQALGAYKTGRMLFLGLGTGVGSALVSEHVLVPLELGSLPHTSGRTIVEHLGRKALEKNGHARWQKDVIDIVPALRQAFLADYVVLGGGNASKVNPLPADTRRGGNRDAVVGGFRLWDETVEPHDRMPAPAWRLVR